MASGARKWLVGCGIGCGLMILALGGIGTCGYFGVRNIKDRAERLEVGIKALNDQYGPPAEFAPPADGVVRAGRLETFLAVREAMAPTREELGRSLTELDADTDGAGGVFRKIRAGMTLLPRLFDFIDERNVTLVDQGMGVGEYLYIYSLVYPVWLGKDPGDGPSFAITGDDEDEDPTTFRWQGGDKDPQEVRARRADEVRRHLNRIQGSMLANQLDAAGRTGLDPAWVAQLEAEAAALDQSSLRLMWQDNLPAAIAAGFEPYREQLEAAYSPVMNVVEVGMVEHD